MRGRNVHVLTMTLVSLSVAACDDGDRRGIDAPWTAEEERRGDTLIVRTVGGSVWGDSATLVPEVVIGELGGDEAYVLGRISSVDVAENGRIFIVDQQARRVRVYTSTGGHELSFGRAGEGPGEFTNPVGVRVMADGRIVVRDQPRRFSLFSSNGEYEGGWPLETGFADYAPFFLDGHGGIVNPTLRGRLVRYDVDGGAADTVAVPTRGFSPPQLEVPMAGGMAWYAIPFMPYERWTLTEEGQVLFGTSDEYAIERWGETEVLRIERDVAPVPVAPAEAAWSRDQITSTIRRTTDPEWQWRGPDIPARKPMFRSLLAGRDGSVWVLRFTQGREEENPDWDAATPADAPRTLWVEPTVADVFDSTGRYLGPVKVPLEVVMNPLPVVTAEHMWAVVRAELGYPQVVRFRIGIPDS